MRKFVKQSEMEAANIPVNVAKLNVMEPAIHVAVPNIDIGFATTAML